MAQINLTKTTTFLPSPDGKMGFGFDIYGNPCKIFADGAHEIIGNPSGLKNIVANLGIGVEADLPTYFVLGDTFVTIDSHKIYTALDDLQWLVNDLVEGQFVTNSVNPIKSLYQFINDELVFLDEQEGFIVKIKVYNNTNNVIPKGKIVTPDGNYQGMPTIKYANARVKNESRLVGVVDIDIQPNSAGTVVKIGPVDGFDTTALILGDLIYLSEDGSGDPTTTRPTDGGYPIVIGAVGSVNINGVIVVDIISSDLTIELTDTNGFPPTQKTNTTLSYNELTRQFTQTPIVSPFHYYVEGEKFEKPAAVSVNWTDVEGEHWFYYTGESLVCLHAPTPSQIQDVILKYAFVASLYWNATDKKVEFDLFEERHGINMPSSVHLYNHLYLRAQYGSGFGLSDFVVGLGTSDQHSQYGISEGVYADEDITHVGTYSPPNATVPVSYLLGPSYFRTREQANFSVLNAPSNGRLYYNQLLLGSYYLTEVGNNNFVLYHRFVVNGVTKRYITAMGQNEYTTVSAARSGANNEAASIKNGFAIQEAVLIGTIIFQTRNTNITVTSTWSRVGGLITVVSTNHKLITGEVVNVTAIGGSQTTGNKTITIIDENTFTFVGVDNGSSTSSITYVAAAFTNTTKSRIRLTDQNESYVDWRVSALGKGINPTSHAGLTDVLKAGAGVKDGHIDDEAQTIVGEKSFTNTTTFNGDVVFNGDIYQQVTGKIVFVDELRVTDALIYTRNGATLPLGPGELSGFQIIKYNGVNDLQLAVGVDGFARVGDVGALSIIAAREDSMTNGQFTKYNTTTHKLYSSTIAAGDLPASVLYNTNLGVNYLSKYVNGGMVNSGVYEDVNANIFIGGTSSYPFADAKLNIINTALGTNRIFNSLVLDSTYKPNIHINHVSSTTRQYVELTSGYQTIVGFADWVFPFGNVGIGTTTPTAKLTVVDTIVREIASFKGAGNDIDWNIIGSNGVGEYWRGYFIGSNIKFGNTLPAVNNTGHRASAIGFANDSSQSRLGFLLTTSTTSGTELTEVGYFTTNGLTVAGNSSVTGFISSRGARVFKDAAVAMGTTIDFNSTTMYSNTPGGNQTWAFTNINPEVTATVILTMGATLRTITLSQSGITFEGLNGVVVAGVLQNLEINSKYMVNFTSYAPTNVLVSISKITS